MDNSIDRARYYTLRQVASMTGNTYINVWRWVNRGYLRATFFGDQYAVLGADLLYTMGQWERREIELDTPRGGRLHMPVAAPVAV